MTDEEYVRSVWELTARCDGSYRHYSKGTVIVQDTHGHWVDFPTWSAVAEFTRERLEQIRQVEDEITCIHGFLAEIRELKDGPLTESALMRILAREQAALDELRKGMKDQGRV